MTKIEAPEGRILTNGEAAATVVYLSSNDSAENWQVAMPPVEEDIEDVTVNTLISAAQSGALSGTDIIACEELFDPWEAGDFVAGDIRSHNLQIWRCLHDHNSNNYQNSEPGGVANLWAPYHTKDPRYAKPFVKPTAAHDAYNKDEVALFDDGTVRKSTYDGNVYTPSEYAQGWAVVDI